MNKNILMLGAAICAMMLPLGYPSDKSEPSPKHFERNPMEKMVTEL